MGHISHKEISSLGMYVLGGKNQHLKAGAPVLLGMSPASSSAFIKDTEVCGEECTDDKLALSFSVGWRGRRWAQKLAVFKYCDFFFL